VGWPVSLDGCCLPIPAVGHGWLGHEPEVSRDTGRAHRIGEAVARGRGSAPSSPQFPEELAVKAYHRRTFSLVPGDVPTLDPKFDLQSLLQHYRLEVINHHRAAGLDAYHLSRCPLARRMVVPSAGPRSSLVRLLASSAPTRTATTRRSRMYSKSSKKNAASTLVHFG